MKQSNIGEPVMDRYIKLYNAYKGNVSMFGTYDELLKEVKSRLITAIKVFLAHKLTPEERKEFNNLLQAIPNIKTPEDVYKVCKKGNSISK